MKLDKTSVKYLRQVLKVPLDELKIRKTAEEAFSETTYYPIKIVEDWFRRLDTDGIPV